MQEVIDIIGKQKPENDVLCKELSDFTSKDWEALKTCNLISDGRTQYGLRKEEIKRGTLMSWSNGAERWFAHKPVEKGEKVKRLDANEMICPISFERAKRIACYIKELPLYYASTEAKLRGQVSGREALDIFLEGHGISNILDKLKPEHRESIIKDIKKKGWGWFFGEERE